MNKAELASRIADQVNLPKKAGEDMINAFEEIVTKALINGEEVTIAGFGTFSSRKRAGRIGVNPRNPEQQLTINPVRVAKFKVGSALKKAVKQSGQTSNTSNPAS
jgi:DNA-binding protein HU-beta